MNTSLLKNPLLVAVVLFVILGVAAFFVFRDQLPQANRHVLTIENCSVTEGGDFTAKEGDEVTLLVTSDQNAEFHIHGYDLKRDLVAGEEQTITFRASDPGRYDYELEGECELGVLSVTNSEGNIPETPSDEEEHQEDEHEATKSSGADHDENDHD